MIVGNRVNDYGQIYPPDGYMDEMGPNARVFRTYNDESDRSDYERVEIWKNLLNTLLIFVSQNR